MKKILTLTMPDGSVWGVPVDIIALNRAAYYAKDYDFDINRSLTEDTNPFFNADEYEIKDWAANNMNWSDFDGYQFKIESATPLDFQEAWMSGEMNIVEI